MQAILVDHTIKVVSGMFAGARALVLANREPDSSLIEIIEAPLKRQPFGCKVGDRTWIAQECLRFEDKPPYVIDPTREPAMDREGICYTNGVYRVTKYPADTNPACPCPVIHLSFSRVDRGTAVDWRDKQHMKNQLVGPAHEAVELFPADERLVDGANQFHLWVLGDPAARFPLGFRERMVTDKPMYPGVTQRPGSGASRADELAADAMVVNAASRGIAPNSKSKSAQGAKP